MTYFYFFVTVLTKLVHYFATSLVVHFVHVGMSNVLHILRTLMVKANITHMRLALLLQEVNVEMLEFKTLVMVTSNSVQAGLEILVEAQTLEDKAVIHVLVHIPIVLISVLNVETMETMEV